ncbi:Putative beta-mannosyltransferase [Septoria linicola]|uniref:Beta-mannosyltransferase n=1 Tax=Septoria linicola TaxID=215465 RepID=A0A9Q9B1V3_9PEZI|nr:putative beta-mannosyltransferase [Septoria linicola]USW54821.1 Putative beta-mannosyltransferase [Septoria linicola]
MKGLNDEKMSKSPTSSSSREFLGLLAIRSWNPRRRVLRTALFATLLTLTCMLYWRSQVPTPKSLSTPTSDVALIDVSGFVNVGGMQKNEKCEAIRHQGQIGVEESLKVDDDLVAIAKSLDDHPMIDYGNGKKEHTFEELVAKTWLRFAQSSVWLEKHQVYLTVTRVLFYDKGVRQWPVISFIRGQIHDRDWRELKGHVIHWHGEQIVFPKIFDIPTPFTIGGGFYGPEDARIIIEDHPDAEPVIVFNMISDIKTVRRSMYTYRPFSNKATILAIRGKEPGSTEKNWMPFFYKSEDEQESKEPGPNRYIHFVYHFWPLSILRCRLQYGWCDEIYRQDIPDEHRIDHKDTIYSDTGGSLRGGTNFHPVTLAEGKQSFVGFPRTHIDGTCNDGYYRPELAVLSATSDTQFHLDYLSGPIDFGGAVIRNATDSCAEGRILIANSIARWDRTAADDIMTLSVSVDDSTTDIVRLRGIHSLLTGLPGVSAPHKSDASQKDNMALSLPGQDVIGCCVESAIRVAEVAYGKSSQKPLNDAAKIQRQKEEDQKKQNEEATKQKEEREKKQKEEEEEAKRRKAEEAQSAEEEKSAMQPQTSSYQKQHDKSNPSFQQIDITGFVNTGPPVNVSCDTLRYNTTIAVQKSVYLEDDLEAIARALGSHPMVVYRGDNTDISKTWSRMAGSSVWLEEFGVYLSITRIIFYDDGVSSWPVISFIRAQLYDENWKELRRSLTWEGKTFDFPQILDIPVDYVKGGKVYGPEDARITIEQGVKAEPVIVFNMISEKSSWKRAMHVYRPFSQELRMLSIRGRPPLDREKNWAPFFNGDGKTPSRHIMFVYMPSPLEILWCSLDTGECDFAYNQILEPGLLTEHVGEAHALKGGSNFVSIGPGIWLGLPRTHIEANCGGSNPIYRPMFMVMMSSGDSFYVAYASGAVDFGAAVLSEEQQKDPCHAGRILIPNSIARVDGNALTITFSVDDRTNQAARVIMDINWQAGEARNVAEMVNLSAVGNDVLKCGIEASYNNTHDIQAAYYQEHPDQTP